MFILATIFANCVALAVSTPYPGNDSDETNKVLVSFFTIFIRPTQFPSPFIGLCAVCGG